MFDRDPLQMALIEAISHGGNQDDLKRLHQHFRDIANNKSDDENVSTQVGGIPD
jgi:hypothetical protein